MIRIIRRKGLKKDERGATLIEFAIIAPTFMLMLLGLFDLGFTVYMQSALTGVVQNAARSAALETGPSSLTSIDADVERQIQNIAEDANVTFERLSYFDYEGVGQPEVYTDSNGNGQYDIGECFEDVNSNATWDADIGADGIGGPNDVVLYTVSASYERVFPLWKMMGWEQTNVIRSTTVLKNQPYGDQSEQTVDVVCT